MLYQDGLGALSIEGAPLPQLRASGAAVRARNGDRDAGHRRSCACGDFELSPYESCGYELDSFSAPFTALFVTWTVPDLQYTPSPPFGPDPNLFRTFVLAGVARAGDFRQVPLPALARFVAVYFDEISAYTTSGPRSLTSGDAVTMTDQNGSALATPETLNDWAFKVVRD
jgi:hypothetical protein